MSVPPDPPIEPVPPDPTISPVQSEPPIAPVQSEPPSRRWRILKGKNAQGGFVAFAIVLASSALVALSGFGAIGLAVGTLVAFLCVLLGSILTIFERTRVFAVGFLIVSAILIFVTAGVCTVGLRLSSGTV